MSRTHPGTRATVSPQTRAPVQARLAAERRTIDEALARFLDGLGGSPPRLRDAMRHPVFAGGKRLRPILVLAAAEATGLSPDAALPAACAVEFAHTYSLVHDDLPAMDDSPTRRGRPTCHVVFGDAAAILAGDALQAFAFELIVRNIDAPGVTAAGVVRAAAELADGIGPAGMVGGQTLDLLAAEGHAAGVRVTPADLHHMHRMKTGALIRACVRIGGVLGGAPGDDVDALGRYGEHLGLAFQIVDDILDVTGDEAALGKRVGADASHAKITFPLIYGVPSSRRLAEEATARAIAALERFGERGRWLRDLAAFLLARDR